MDSKDLFDASFIPIVFHLLTLSSRSDDDHISTFND